MDSRSRADWATKKLIELHCALLEAAIASAEETLLPLCGTETKIVWKGLNGLGKLRPPTTDDDPATWEEIESAEAHPALDGVKVVLEYMLMALDDKDDESD